MSNYTDWTQALKKTEDASDFDKRQSEDKDAKTERIKRDPRPEYAPPVVKPYATTEMHYILCVDDENANLSMPEASELYGAPHKIGNLLLSDRKEVPFGFIKMPPKGSSIEVLKEAHPDVYEVLLAKKITNF